MFAFKRGFRLFSILSRLRSTSWMSICLVLLSMLTIAFTLPCAGERGQHEQRPPTPRTCCVTGSIASLLAQEPHAHEREASGNYREADCGEDHVHHSSPIGWKLATGAGKSLGMFLLKPAGTGDPHTCASSGRTASLHRYSAPESPQRTDAI